MKNLWRVALAVGFMAGLVVLERKRPLRRNTQSKLRRNGRNVVVGGLAAATIHFLETPIVQPLSKLVERRRWGLLKRLRLPRALEVFLALVLMDYTLYLWHILAHRLPLLWRFHAPHHVDLDMDASTALRFHFGELALSVPFRAAQLLLIGVDSCSFASWQSAVSLCILFHHSNVRLSENSERVLSRIIVTPCMHGIHHSNDPREASSNWSSGLSLWDLLHGTFRTKRYQPAIGVRGIDNPEQVTLPEVLAMPFTSQPAIETFLEEATSSRGS